MHEHQWVNTGKQGVHVEFPTKTKGVNQLWAIYVRCRECKQDGFVRPGRMLVHTWAKEDAA